MKDSSDTTSRDRPDWLSPSLAAVPDGGVPAYEMKFAVAPAEAPLVEEWAGRHLRLDPHADPALGNGYRITSVYFDTPAFDVYRRADGYRVHKYRVRRYGGGGTAHLERKSKRGGRVWKCRASVPLDELRTRPLADLPSDWFVREVGELGLRPVCAVTYLRTAYIGVGPDGPIRLTMDRAAFGAVTAAVSLDPPADGVPLLSDAVVVELKFLSAMPALFKGLVAERALAPTGISKYRRCASALRLSPVAAAEGAGDV